MVKLAIAVKTKLNYISLSTDDLFKDFKKTIKILNDKSMVSDDNNSDNFESIKSQIPDGIYTSVEILKNVLIKISEKNNGKQTTYSPIITDYKIFDACKKISYLNGNIITGRDNEINKILTTLSRKNKCGVILVGEAGTGKTAIIQELNTRLINSTVPFPLKGCKIHSLDIPHLFTKYKDDGITKLVNIIETANADNKHILFIDEVHQLLTEKFNDVLKPYLTENIRFIGATTVDEYHSIVTQDKAIERRFTVIHVSEPTVEETVQMLINTKTTFEKYHNCVISANICKYIVENASRFLGHRRNPDKSFDIIDKACAIMNIKSVSHNITNNKKYVTDLSKLNKNIDDIKSETTTTDTRTLNEHYVNLAISDIANIDYNYIKNSLNYNEIVKNMKMEIVGQDNAIKELSNIANIMKHVNHNRSRPISILLTVGTHGVGKTKTIKQLAKNLYGSEKHVIEYDLAEFSQEFQLTELKGAPPGYVGYQKSGKLIKEIKNNPQSVVLFKHVNKCHPTILDYLLTSVKNGKLMDAAEREVRLNNTIIVFSVSLEENENDVINKKQMGFINNDNTSTNTLSKIISKNILDAVDSTIHFNTLTTTDLHDIFNMSVKEVISMYNNVDLDIESLKNDTFNNDDCKNGHDVFNKLTSTIPKLIFNQLS